MRNRVNRMRWWSAGTAILGSEREWDEAQDVLRITGYSAEPIRLEGIRLVKKK